jgi:hypothetical protein
VHLDTWRRGHAIGDRVGLEASSGARRSVGAAPVFCWLSDHVILNMRSQVRWPRGMRSDEILHSSTRNIKSCAKYGNQSFKSTTRRNTCTTINLTANIVNEIAEREASLRCEDRISDHDQEVSARPYASSSHAPGHSSASIPEGETSVPSQPNAIAVGSAPQAPVVEWVCSPNVHKWWQEGFSRWVSCPCAVDGGAM